MRSLAAKWLIIAGFFFSWQILPSVGIPAAAPSIFTGFRLAAAYGFMVLVAADMVGANAGLGFLVLDSQEVFRIPEMHAAILTLAVFGLGVNNVLQMIEKRVTRGSSVRRTTAWRINATSPRS